MHVPVRKKAEENAMTINIICETAPGFSFHYKKLAQTVIEQSLDSEGFPYEAEVNLTLVDEKRIHEINLETRQIDAPTDVLSFPMFEKDEIESIISAEDDEQIEDVLGDIMISIPRVIEQAEEYGHSVQRELAYMVVHGFYHVMGYDHMNEQEKSVMRQKEEKILSKLNITRQ